MEFTNAFKRGSKDTGIGQIECQTLEYADRVLVTVSLNGEVDTTYDLPLNSLGDVKRPSRRYDLDLEMENEENLDEDGNHAELNNSIVPNLIIGVGNLKTEVLASQIGLLLNQFTSKNIILNISGKFFKGDEYSEGDYQVLHVLLALVRESYLHETPAKETEKITKTRAGRDAPL
ncbi:hypothetical protein DAMA08_045430 [Martiniozyma asiatica (nom. inval.)]|nr:hypothetical protein DAMA08_045430 [Martiniozyma asiatica]